MNDLDEKTQDVIADEKERKIQQDYFNRISKCPYCSKIFTGTVQQTEQNRINHIKEKHPEKRPFKVG